MEGMALFFDENNKKDMKMIEKYPDLFDRK